MRNSFKDPALQAEFARNGYVVVPLFSPEDAARHRQTVGSWLPSAPQINDPQEAVYLSLFDEERRIEGGKLAHEIAAGPLEAMLDDYYDAATHFIVKVPGSGALDMHQHQPVTADIFEPVIHAWTTLDDVDADSGALRVVPGSHALLRHVQSFNARPYFSDFAARLEAHHAITVPMRAGECLLFERSLLHGSAPNRSAQPSLRVLSTFLPSESKLCILTEDEETFEAFEVGAGHEFIDPELFCIAGGISSSLKRAGTIENRNTLVSEVEFTALLRLKKRIAPGYDPIDEVRAALPIALRAPRFRQLLERWRTNSPSRSRTG